MSGEQKATTRGWRFAARVVAKALLLFALLNAVFAVLQPMEWLGQFSLYGSVYPLRPRLPYGENPDESYNITLNNIPAMFASHVITQPKAPDEYRVLLIGDSSAWGWLLENADTLAAVINRAHYEIGGQTVTAYNLGYPVMSLTKDLLILDEALHYQPDVVVWLVSLASFPPEQQTFPPLVQHNAGRLLSLISAYNLHIASDDPALIQPDFWARTIIGQRRPLADLLRLQTYGASWAATGIDQAIPVHITITAHDLEADESWGEAYPEAAQLTRESLAFDVLAAGIAQAGDVPLVVINEPMFISDGTNSDIRYNSFYPRWAYDQYRALLAEISAENGWHYHDLWDVIAPEEFTDSPVHLTPNGTQILGGLVGDVILQTATSR
ncbi:MAG: SGNH/GDSL hydrolase family protein [Anaerolineaceae bacterium]|nr:SGNH/GDSL hydrolase family protein [Anaerolineaceae bacterium]